MANLFTLLIYQPFLNILVGIYWLLGITPRGNPDMGIAVIIFTVFVRVLMLPLTFSGERTEKERREIAEKLRLIELEYGSQPVALEKKKKQLLRGNKRILISELITLGIQIMLAIMLWRIFAKGLPGEDLHLIYDWMPDVHQPFNLLFAGKYDLTHPHVSLNIIQSLLIMVLETLFILSSPYKVSRSEVVRLELTLPLVSFFVFMFLPAGKKLFVITSLIFSIFYKLGQMITRGFNSLMTVPEPAVVEGAAPSEPLSSVPPPTQPTQEHHDHTSH